MSPQLEKEPLRQGRADYEPPRVERVLSPAELTSEVLYAGINPTPVPL